VKELVTVWAEERARLGDGARRIDVGAAPARRQVPGPAPRPTAARGAEGMPRPARPAAAGPAQRLEKPDARSDSQPAKDAAAEPNGRGGDGSGSQAS
jgi:D-aminopeptidase